MLAQLFPNYIPPLLAVKPEWSGWLSQEVEGEQLGESPDDQPWETAAGDLASLQIEGISHRSRILVSGARDLGAVGLTRSIEPFLETMARLMNRQTKVPPPIVGREQLRLLGERVREAIDLCEGLGIPATLGHLDLNPGNVIVSSDSVHDARNRCVFLDWAEAYVGNPFLSLQYLIEYLRRMVSGAGTIRIGAINRKDLETRMISAYCGPWERVMSPEAISEALILSPLLAVFAYAAGSDAWKSEKRLGEPGAAAHLRSLTRRMEKEVRELETRRRLCLR
jgi:hypothetical protein